MDALDLVFHRSADWPRDDDGRGGRKRGIHYCTALRVTMRESSLEVVQGDFVILPCSFFISTSTRLSRLNVIWTLAPFSSPETPIQVIVYDHGQVIEDPSLTGRVGFTGIPLSADIVLNDTRVSDAGIYRCMVNNPPETADPGIGELALSVLGKSVTSSNSSTAGMLNMWPVGQNRASRGSNPALKV
uniref:Ig-like domain-containing protein n=1 Tax=Amphiprion ocellaris TaxID=80972 RepID=A0AAQ6AIB4_AMPOC